MAKSITLRNKEEVLKFIVNHRVNIYAVTALIIHIILIIAVLASNQWVLGSTSYRQKTPTYSFGLFKNCALDRTTGSEILCASYDSTSWLDGVKALLIIPLLLLFLMTPVIFIGYLGENGDEQVNACKIAHGTSFIAGTLISGACRLFSQHLLDFPLRSLEFGWPFWLTIVAGGFFLIEIMIFYPLKKFVPKFFDITQKTEETPEGVVPSNDVESADVVTYDNKVPEKDISLN